jgi:integrase
VEGLGLWAILTVGVFGLLRLGEILELRVSDITFVTDSGVKAMVINIAKSKTDPFRLGVKVRCFKLAEVDEPICPVRAMEEFLAARKNTSKNLWVCHPKKSTRVNRAGVVKALQKLIVHYASSEGLGWDPSAFTGHSLRRGGATSLFAAGISADLVKILGRWKSNCYLLYLETPVAKVARAQAQMARLELGQVWPVMPNIWDSVEI